MTIERQPLELTATVHPAEIMYATVQDEVIEWLLLGAGIDLGEIKARLREWDKEDRAKLEAEIEAVDEEARALEERRAELMRQLYGWKRAGDGAGSTESTEA